MLPRDDADLASRLAVAAIASPRLIIFAFFAADIISSAAIDDVLITLRDVMPPCRCRCASCCYAARHSPLLRHAPCCRYYADAVTLRLI